MAQAKKNLQIRLSDDVRELLSELCYRERTTPPRLIERLIRERAANPVEFYAHCAAVQSNAAYVLLGTLIGNLYPENDYGLNIIRTAALSARELYGNTPPPPETLRNRDITDPKVAAINRAFFESD